ncbi:forkhead box protein D1-like [Meriones unguiculatus]|uniref:forkhead box protein D1-like n=1 Tax=Meriones unguiculatus TaxID=10047 RepID=UPI00293EE098|nr:forkhead box protein D1-like [Meriones unguiculatus]
MMRTGPAASGDTFERPPWQGWELSPHTAPSVLRSPARLPSARPCTRAPGYRTALPPKPPESSRPGRRPAWLPALLRVHSPPQTRPLRPQRARELGPRRPDGTSSGEGRATAACSRAGGHRGDTVGAPGSRPSPGTRQPGKGLGGGSGRRANVPAGPLQEEGSRDRDPPASRRAILELVPVCLLTRARKGVVPGFQPAEDLHHRLLSPVSSSALQQSTC